MKNNKGMAMVEALPILLVMFVLMGATLGSWGIVHTAILHSIAARSWTFFYFNNRSDLSYLRDWIVPGTDIGTNIDTAYFRADNNNTSGMGKRYMFIQSEKAPDGSEDRIATLRKVDFRDVAYSSYPDRSLPEGTRTRIDDNTTGLRNKMATSKWEGNKSRAWIMVGYGICLDAKCGRN